MGPLIPILIGAVVELLIAAIKAWLEKRGGGSKELQDQFDAAKEAAARGDSGPLRELARRLLRR